MIDWIKKGALWLFGGSAWDNRQQQTTGYKFSGTTPDGLAVDENTALSIGAVYACVRLISTSVASLPLQVFKSVNDISEKNPSHPLYFLLNGQPNQHMTSFDWRVSMFSQALLWGNSYTFIQTGLDGRPIALYPLRSDRMTVEITNDAIRYIYRQGSNTTVYPENQIIHFKGLTLDGLVGISVIEAARRTLLFSQSLDKFGTSLFANGARPSGVLKHPGALSPEAAQRLRDSFDSLYSGLSNVGRMVVLEEGLEYSPLTINPVDLEFISSRKFSVSEIARLFGVPEILINQAEKPTYASVEQTIKAFHTFTLLPLLKSSEQAMNSKLFPAGTQHYARFNYSGFLRSNDQERGAYYRTLREIGVLSVNEIRALEELPPVEYGDTRLQPLNFGPLGSATQHNS